jgi:hypothetical protein
MSGKARLEAVDATSAETAGAPIETSSETLCETSAAALLAGEQEWRNEVGAPKTLSIPEAGFIYFGLSKAGSYNAADRGEFPVIRIGRLRRVPIAAMEQMMLTGRAHNFPLPASRAPRAPRYPLARKPRTGALRAPRAPSGIK